MALVADVAASRAGASRVKAYAASLVAGLCATFGLLLLLPIQTAVATFGIAFLAYGAWWFTFLNLVQSLESSLRVRLLGEVRAAGGRISLAMLEARYNDDTLLCLRLDRLRAHGSVTESAGRLRVASPGLKAIAGFFRFLKRTLLGRISEFGAPTG